MRKDLLRYRLLIAIKQKNAPKIIAHTQKWLREFPKDIEPVLVLQKSSLPLNPQILSLKKEAFKIVWNRLEAHLKRFPNSAPSLNAIAWLGANTGQNIDKSITYARRAYKLEKNTAYLDTLAQCLYSAGQLDEAIELLKVCVKLEPNTYYFSQKLALWAN